MRRIINYLNREQGGLHQAALLLGLSSLASQLLGLLRDRLLASEFGAGDMLDVYYAAFRVPDLIFVCIGSFIAITVVIPILVNKLESSKEAAKKFLGSMLTFFLVTTVFVDIIAFVSMPWIAQFIVPGFSLEKTELFVVFSRILLLSPLLLGLSNLFGAVTQSYKRFIWYAASPLAYNIGIIFGVLVLYPLLGPNGLVLGVVLGALGHFVLQIPFAVGEGVSPSIFSAIDWKELGAVVKTSLPRTLALGSNQIAFIFLVSIASLLATGSVAVFNLAFNLQSVPLALIGVSYSVAAFPTIAGYYAKGRLGEFRDCIDESLRHIIFWSLPVAALFIVLRAQIVRTILGVGEFDWNDTRLAAAAIAFFSIAVVFQCVIQLLDRVYYSMNMARRPVVIKLISSAFIIATAFLFTRFNIFFQPMFDVIYRLFKVSDIPGTEVLVLPIAFTIGMSLNALMLWAYFSSDLGIRFSKQLYKTIAESVMGSVVMGTVAYFTLNILSSVFNTHTTLGIFAQGLFSGLLGLFVGIVILYIGGSKELADISYSIKHRVKGVFPISSGTENLG